jgi:dsDNA-binding SOS-regulon protein
MKVYVVIETCCFHFKGVFKDKAEADAYAKECDYSVYEYEL